jgi:ketosteroid isomerase-like protein
MDLSKPGGFMRALAAVGILMILAGCQAPPAEMTQAEIAQMEAEVTQVIADRWAGFWESVVAKDYEEWASYWTSDTRVLQTGVDMSGTAWFDYVRELFESGAQWHTFDIESFDFFVHGNVAYQIGQWDETATLDSGEPVEWNEYFFIRWVKGDDGLWRLSRLLSTPRDAPAEG